MFDREGFRQYFLNEVGAAPNTMNTYNSFLNRIDIASGGLDEAIERDGAEGVAVWATQSEDEPFATYRSHARSVLKRYLQYRIERASTEIADAEEIEVELEALQADANFRVEKEMQAQVRLQIGQVEPGLQIDDGGVETTVATGRIDIVARDQQGRLVAIELKAGKCPAGAMEQVLAYAHSLSLERQEPVRAMLIAGSFGDRIRAAAKRATDIDLKTYAYSLAFDAAD
jgi:RecB family endonuclease NucS